jgi:hypothetical protein
MSNLVTSKIWWTFPKSSISSQLKQGKKLSKKFPIFYIKIYWNKNTGGESGGGAWLDGGVSRGEPGKDEMLQCWAVIWFLGNPLVMVFVKILEI